MNKPAKIVAYCYHGRPWLRRTGDEVRVAGIVENLSEICCLDLDIYCQGELWQVFSSGRVAYREIPSFFFNGLFHKQQKQYGSSSYGLTYDNSLKVIIRSFVFLVKNRHMFNGYRVILAHGPLSLAPIIVKLLKLGGTLNKNTFLFFDPQANYAQTLYLRLTQSRGLSRLTELLKLGIFILLQKLQFRSSDAIMFPSSYDADNAIRMYKLPEREVHVVPTASSITYRDEQEWLRLREVYRAKLNLTNKDIALIYTAGSKVEANQLLLTKLSQLTRLFSREDLCLIVTGPWKDLAHKFKGWRIVFTGTVDRKELIGLLAASDIGLSPIIVGAGMSTKALDYFVAGLIIVATPLVLKGIDSHLRYAEGQNRLFVLSSYDDLEEKLGNAIEKIRSSRVGTKRVIITRTLSKQIMQVYIANIAKVIKHAVASFESS